MEEREAKAVTKEQVYQKQMEDLGIWQDIFLPELRTLCRCERELTRAEKAWSNTAPPGGKPSFLDDHYPVIEKLRNEILQHRQALGLTPQSFRKLTGVNAGGDTPEQKDLISSKLDQIAARVAGYDLAPGGSPELGLYIESEQGPELVVPRDSEDSLEAAWGAYLQTFGVDPRQDPYAGIPAADEAAAISDMMDRQERAEDINDRLAKGVGPGPRGEICSAADAAARISDLMDEELRRAVHEDMG